jgi:hypothetical protein
MKIAYSAPAKGEIYAISRKAARRIVRSICSELPLLAFQTMHGPKMSADLPYLATYSSRYVRLLSVRAEHVNADLERAFHATILPHIVGAVLERRRTSYQWPAVVVAIDGSVHEVPCSEGGLFPSREEVMDKVRKNSRAICRYGVAYLGVAGSFLVCQCRRRTGMGAKRTWRLCRNVSPPQAHFGQTPKNSSSW